MWAITGGTPQGETGHAERLLPAGRGRAQTALAQTPLAHHPLEHLTEAAGHEVVEDGVDG